MIKLYLNPSDSITQTLNKYDLNEPIEIHLSPGQYYEKLEIKHQGLKLIGHDFQDTSIIYDDYSYKMHEDGLLYNTFRTSTVTVLSDDVSIENITIENRAGHGFTIGQAIALSLYGNHSKISHCYLKGNQDTLFLGPLPKDLTERYDDFLQKPYLHTRRLYHHIEFSVIEGNVDFIFGCGISLLNHCKIIANDAGYVFAPSTYEDFPYGIIVINSNIISKHKDVYIARPWRNFGKLTLLNTTFEGEFHEDRYQDWDKDSFDFKESPYIINKFSHSLKAEEIEQLKLYIKLHFNCSIKN